jgi:hypothetical protein
MKSILDYVFIKCPIPSFTIRWKTSMKRRNPLHFSPGLLENTAAPVIVLAYGSQDDSSSS